MELSDTIARPATADRGGEVVAAKQDDAAFDRIFRFASIAGGIALVFLAGAFSVIADVFPGPQLQSAYAGGRAMYDKRTTVQNVYLTDLWMDERRPDRGITRADLSRAQDGLTLYTSGHAPAATLLDMDGTVLHEWRKPFSEVWNPDAPEAHPKTPQPDEFVYFRKALTYPNGDLIAVYEAAGDTPYGYGVVKLDRDSNVIWTYLGPAHHDIDIGPDGNIYLLTHEIVNEPPKFGPLATPRVEDFLVVLDPDGRELRKLALTDIVAKSQWRHLLHTVTSYAVADPLHANTVKVISAREATRFPFATAGQVLFSFRELGALFVIDIDREEAVWAARGPWIGQHDPDLLPNGHILLFDNYGHFSDEEGISRVIEFDPKTMRIAWQYTGTEDEPFRSTIRSWQQRLPNGNTFIVESNGGRVFEVTRAGEIVWEFINPVRHEGEPSGTKIPVIGWAERLDRNHFTPGVLGLDAM